MAQKIEMSYLDCEVKEFTRKVSKSGVNAMYGMIKAQKKYRYGSHNDQLQEKIPTHNLMT